MLNVSQRHYHVESIVYANLQTKEIDKPLVLDQIRAGLEVPRSTEVKAMAPQDRRDPLNETAASYSRSLIHRWVMESLKKIESKLSTTPCPTSCLHVVGKNFLTNLSD